MVSIRGCGTYLPLYRIQRTDIAEQHGDYAGGGETAVPAHDEEVLTLAVRAAKNALHHAGGDVALDAVYVASTSDPFDERGIAPHVAYAIGAGGSRVADFQGSARAATNAFLAAMDAIEAGNAEAVLVAATDILQADAGSPAERTAGAGAAAVVLAADGGLAAVTGTASNTTGFIGRFKRAGTGPQLGDGRYNREQYVAGVGEAVDRLREETTVEPDHVAMPAPDGRWGGRALSSLEMEAQVQSTFDEIGYAGAASVLIDAVLAIERARAGDDILLVSYGPGGFDAVAMTRNDGDPSPDTTTEDYLDSKEYVSYAKHREYRARAGGEA